MELEACVAGAQPVFPAGLRVLVVDDDPLCLRIVEKMLKRCLYEGAFRRTNASLLHLTDVGSYGRPALRWKTREEPRVKGFGDALGSRERPALRTRDYPWGSSHGSTLYVCDERGGWRGPGALVDRCPRPRINRCVAAPYESSLPKPA